MQQRVSARASDWTACPKPASIYGPLGSMGLEVAKSELLALTFRATCELEQVMEGVVQ